eukprot:gene10660-10819_t
MSWDAAALGLEAGAQTLQAGARARIGAGARQLQNVLRNIERQVQEFQRQQQQRDLQVLEDMSQEFRSRFWYVLLQRPDLAMALMVPEGGGLAGPPNSSSEGHAGPPNSSSTAPENRSSSAATAAEGDGWEMVSSDVPSAPVGGSSSSLDQDVLVTLQTLVTSLSEKELSDPVLLARQAVFKLMTNVPWQQGSGIPSSWQEDEEYCMLLEQGCGAFEEVILRDVPRTFPEHPLFAPQSEGQQRLLRLLKAYAAADPEVGYCQGMAFAAGVLLMYLPEEAAFRLYRRIMNSGPNLRRLYLPGLDPLKLELSRFELVLATHQPQLHQHLLEAGLPALLYAAQWLMTTYSCPFPVHVAARVLDVLLQSDSDAILPRLGLAVMKELQQHLLELDDFEALITYLKVKPLSWPLAVHRQVIYSAIDSPASDQELAAATAAAEAELLSCAVSYPRTAMAVGIS